MNRKSSFAQQAGHAAALLLLAGSALACWAQVTSGPGALDSTQIGTRFPDKTSITDHQDETQEIRRMRLLNAARQRSMVSDAEKLLALARELDAGTGAGGNALSAGQKMKMAADIEKLARNVKEKMSFVVGAPPFTPTTPAPPSGWPK